MTEPIPINDLTFGVELEIILPRGSNGLDGRALLAIKLIDAGLAARAEEYNHYQRPHWKLTTDQTIGYDNVELVSPILKGADGFDQLRRVCRTIVAFGASVDQRCGLHVHIGVKERFSQQVGFFKELAKTYAKFEPIIDQLMAPSRRARNSSWCQPVMYNDRIANARTIDEIIQIYGGGDRHYFKVNFGAFNRHGTVEFRHHQGTTNYSKISNWVQFCLRLVAHSARNTEMNRADNAAVHSPPPQPRQPDLNTATLVEAADLTASNIRFYGRSYTISAMRSFNPRRRGSHGYDNWHHYQVGMTIRQYRANGGLLDELRWDVAHHNVRVVNATTARVQEPLVAPEPVAEPPEQLCAGGHLERTCTTVCMRSIITGHICRDFGGTPHHAPAPVIRPPTDNAPTTLAGLLDLIGAAPEERSFFTERQMELNSQ